MLKFLWSQELRSWFWYPSSPLDSLYILFNFPNSWIKSLSRNNSQFVVFPLTWYPCTQAHAYKLYAYPCISHIHIVDRSTSRFLGVNERKGHDIRTQLQYMYCTAQSESIVLWHRSSSYNSSNLPIVSLVLSLSLGPSVRRPLGTRTKKKQVWNVRYCGWKL